MPVVLVLAVGIGATTAVFTLANGVLLRPLPFAAPERLVLLDESAPARGIPSMGTNLPNLRAGDADGRRVTPPDLILISVSYKHLPISFSAHRWARALSTPARTDVDIRQHPGT